jgi:hypothetical protein
MAERAGMTALVDFVERLVNDPANEAHSRDDIQAALDVYRIEARYSELAPLVTYGGGGASYLTFQAATGYWESSAVLYNASYTALTPATSDPMAGRWTFATEPARPVTVLGWTHDPYQAAADLVEVRAAQLAEQYDFSTGPDSFSRSQRYKQLMDLAGRYRAMSPRLKALATATETPWAMPEVVVDVFAF